MQKTKFEEKDENEGKFSNFTIRVCFYFYSVLHLVIKFVFAIIILVTLPKIPQFKGKTKDSFLQKFGEYEFSEGLDKGAYDIEDDEEGKEYTGISDIAVARV